MNAPVHRQVSHIEIVPCKILLIQVEDILALLIRAIVVGPKEILDALLIATVVLDSAMDALSPEGEFAEAKVAEEDNLVILQIQTALQEIIVSLIQLMAPKEPVKPALVNLEIRKIPIAQQILQRHFARITR
jgi:hypothetical protein